MPSISFDLNTLHIDGFISIFCCLLYQAGVSVYKNMSLFYKGSYPIKCTLKNRKGENGTKRTYIMNLQHRLDRYQIFSPLSQFFSDSSTLYVKKARYENKKGKWIVWLSSKIREVSKPDILNVQHKEYWQLVALQMYYLTILFHLEHVGINGEIRACLWTSLFIGSRVAQSWAPGELLPPSRQGQIIYEWEGASTS